MKKCFIILIATLFCCHANAQNDNDTLSIQRDEKGQIRFAKFKIDATSDRKMQNDTLFLKSVLSTKTGDSFSKIKDETDESGVTHRKFQQYYKGIKVENAEYIVHGKDGNIEEINGDFQNINVSTITYSLTEQQALKKALDYVGAQKYKWEDAGMEEFAKHNTGKANASYYPKSELVFSKDFLNGNDTLKLSWKFTISSMIPDNEQLIYVDAHNGNIINDVPLICNTNTAGTAQTLYSGTQPVICDLYSGSYRLQETRNGVSIQTKNLNNNFNTVNAVDFVNSSASWISTNWTTFSQNRCALDVHWGAEKVLDYWNTVFGRNSINGNGLQIMSYVHYNPNPSSYVNGWSNAQWVGGTNNNYMRYGDGDGTTFKPLTALDICAHEFGHGITQFTARLVSGYQESGALNEGFSDIWGACIEYWAAPNKQTWLIGEEIFFPVTGYSCLRNLQNPKSTTSGEGQHPDTYQGQYWSNVGEPHCNSTVLSHWFYILSQGKTGTNDLGNSYSVTGIGIDKAQRIAFSALSNYLTSSATYTDARNATISAATNLYTSGSAEVIAVTNAWHAVGVGDRYPTSITSPYYFCSSATFTVVSPPPNYTWTCSANLTPGAASGNSKTFSSTSGGYGWVAINVGSTEVARRNVAVSTGTPSSINVTITSTSTPNTIRAIVSTSSTSFPDAYEWICDGWTVTPVYESGVPSGEHVLLTRQSSYDPVMIVRVHNACGWNYKPVTIMPSYLSASPNPASSLLNIEIEDLQPAIANAAPIQQAPPTGNVSSANNNPSIVIPPQPVYEVKIFNTATGVMVYQQTMTGKSKQIDVSGLPNGIYTLSVSDGSGNPPMTQQIVVAH